MTLSVEHTPDSERLRDYVLGLLSPTEAREVAGHVAGCDRCQDVVRREQAVGQMVRLTVERAARPDPARLRARRPLPRRHLWPLQRAVALAGVILILAVGGLMLPGTPAGDTVWQQPVTMVSTPSLTPTRTQTNTPTVPVTATQVAEYEPIRTPLAPLTAPPPPEGS
jgi:anti-sigma factor RsiW